MRLSVFGGASYAVGSGAVNGNCVAPAARGDGLALRSARLAPDQRVHDRETREAIEVPIRRPQFADTVLPTQGHNAGVMDPRAGNSSANEQRPQCRPVVGQLGQKHKGRRLEPSIHLIEGARQRRGRRVDTGTGDDGEKFVNARPGNRLGRLALREFRNSLRGCVVKRRVLAMSVNENVGVDGDQAPRPSKARSRSLSHEAPWTSSCNPLPLKLARRSLNGAPGLVSATMRRSPRSISARSVTPSRSASSRASRRSDPRFQRSSS